MSQSNGTTKAQLGAPGSVNTPPPVAWAYNPKLEVNFDDDDALGELETVPFHGADEREAQHPQKGDGQTAPPASTGPKRKRPLKLTDSQRERKRAIDREAQRSIRIKTKNYIAHLENLVKVMEESDAAGPDGETNRTRELMNQLRQSQEEVRRLREAILGVQRSLGSALGEALPAEADSQTQRNSSTSGSPPLAPQQLNTDSQNTTRKGSATQMQSQPDDSTPINSVPLPSQRKTSTKEIPERPKADYRERQMEGEMFFYSEYQLNRVIAHGPSSFANQPFDEDIVVRAVLEGWNAVEDHYDLDLGWQALREIDQSVWVDCGLIERLAILRLMRTKLLHQVNSKSSGSVAPQPTFFQQEVMKHDAHADIVDHFVWPGFRHAIYSSPNKYITNYFNDKFRRNLRFAWPYDVGDAFSRDSLTGLYAVTPEFVGRQMDLRCWTMRKQFFQGAQELLSAIPIFEAALAKSLPPPPLGVRQSSFSFDGHRQVGMIEEQEVLDEEDLNQRSMEINPNVQHAGDMHWHITPVQSSQHQYWPMEQGYMGLPSQTDSGYLNRVSGSL